MAHQLPLKKNICKKNHIKIGWKKIKSLKFEIPPFDHVDPLILCQKQ